MPEDGVYCLSLLVLSLVLVLQGVDVVVGTPGRVKDHIERGTLKLHKLKFRWAVGRILQIHFTHSLLQHTLPQCGTESAVVALSSSRCCGNSNPVNGSDAENGFHA